ncbi:MAG: hypothetical protein AB6733_13565 [Clostridiaceae bacterium]
MIQLIISLLALGFVDCLNPATIATLIILMPMVKMLKIRVDSQNGDNVNNVI